MLIKIIKSVFNFYMLCVQPLLGLFLVGYSVWRFSDKGICTADKVICDTSVLLEPASYFVIGTVVLVSDHTATHVHIFDHGAVF